MLHKEKLLLLHLLPLFFLSAASLSTNLPKDRYYTCNYHLHTDKVSREEATLRCEKQGGKLAVIQSATQNEEVRQLLQAAELDSVWIGLFLTDSVQQWDDGTSLGFSKLDPTDTGPASGANVLMGMSGRWYLMKEKHWAGFVCGVARRFVLFSLPLTQTGSSDTCTENSMELARVASSQDVRQVRRLIKEEGVSRRHHWYWVGGENPTATGIWQWSDGTPAVGLNVNKTSGIKVGPLYVAINKKSGRMRPLHNFFLNPFICQCPNYQEPKADAQLDYGQINDNGEYVPLFRSFAETKRRVVDLDHDHGDDVEEVRMRYSYFPSRVTHGSAQSHCRSLGGDLACPRSQLQQTQILEVVKSNSWLGMVDVDEEGVWRCVGDDSLLTFTYWYQGFGRGAVPEPDNMTDRRKPGAGYVQILYDPDRRWRHGRWIDRGAPEYEFVVRSAFVCEFTR